MRVYTFCILLCVAAIVVLPVVGEPITKIFGSVPKTGVNQLTIDNSDTGKEAIILFKEMNWPIPFVVYVPPYQIGTMKLPSKTYDIYYSLGNGWDPSSKRFRRDAEYFMVSTVFNAGESGTVHDVKTRPQNIVHEYVDQNGTTRQVITESDPAEWKWAESYLSLSLEKMDGFPKIKIDETEFPDF